MRIRNRQTKATMWTDGDLLRWHRDKREFYRSLWACAEDSCCIIDDMFELKLTAWSSPLDSDITVELMERWRDELIECGKLIPYEDSGRRYFFIPTMAEHEKPRNPQAPDWPLPPYIQYTVTGDGRNRRCTYVFSYMSGDRSGYVQSESGDRETSPALPCPVLPCPDQREERRAVNAEVDSLLGAFTGDRSSALPSCLSKAFPGTSWQDSDGNLHPTAAAAFWASVEIASGCLVSTADHGTFCGIVKATCRQCCEGSEDDVARCLSTLKKAAAKSKGKPSGLFRTIAKEDR